MVKIKHSKLIFSHFYSTLCLLNYLSPLFRHKEKTEQKYHSIILSLLRLDQTTDIYFLLSSSITHLNLHQNNTHLP